MAHPGLHAGSIVFVKDSVRLFTGDGSSQAASQPAAGGILAAGEAHVEPIPLGNTNCELTLIAGGRQVGCKRSAGQKWGACFWGRPAYLLARPIGSLPSFMLLRGEWEGQPAWPCLPALSLALFHWVKHALSGGYI